MQKWWRRRDSQSSFANYNFVDVYNKKKLLKLFIFNTILANLLLQS